MLRPFFVSGSGIGSVICARITPAAAIVMTVSSPNRRFLFMTLPSAPSAPSICYSSEDVLQPQLHGPDPDPRDDVAPIGQRGIRHGVSEALAIEDVEHFDPKV